MSTKPGFWRQFLAALRRDTPAFKPEQRPMSPIEMYEAGGGNLATASPFVQELMRKADESHCEQRKPEEWPVMVEIPEPRKLDHTAPATLTQYLLWLDGFIKQGGVPTHYYDYPFERAGFTYAISNVEVDSDAEYGAQSRHIIVPRGRKVGRTDPLGGFGGWAHTNLYLMDDYGQIGHWVPVYSDPEFEIILTETCRETREQQDSERRHFRAGIERRRSARRNPAEGSDDAALRMLGGATFGPNASLTLPSGLTLSADEAQVFTSLYADDKAEPDTP